MLKLKNEEVKNYTSILLGLYFTKNFVEIFITDANKNTSSKNIIYDNVFNINSMINNLYNEVLKLTQIKNIKEIVGIGAIVTNDFYEDRIFSYNKKFDLKEALEKRFFCKVYIGSRASCIFKKCMLENDKNDNTALISVSSEVDTVVLKDGTMIELSNKNIFQLDLIKLTKNAMINAQDSQMWEVSQNDLDLADDYTAIYSAINGDEFALQVLNNYIISLVKYIIKVEEVTQVKIIIVRLLFRSKKESITNNLEDYILEFKIENNKVLETKIKIVDEPYINMAQVAVDLISKREK